MNERPYTDAERAQAADDEKDDLIRKLEAELDEIAHAIGGSRFMDPPDGGDVSLAEQVRRMRARLDRHESLLKLETVDIATLVDRAEKKDDLIRDLVEAMDRIRDFRVLNARDPDPIVEEALAKAKAMGFEP